jgi:poly-gamma-glutamate system protein
VVELLKEAGVEEGDNVAICMTGSFPALNMSTLAALQTLEANPIIISSVTSSTWGATDPEFTWLDMHDVLYRKGIFKHRAIAASIGGNRDIGRALSEEGRTLALEAIERNDLTLINGSTLESNVSKRMELFQNNTLSKPVKLYINIGGGIASLGSRRNGFALKPGLNEDIKLENFPDKKGVVFHMAQMKVPIIHLLQLNTLMNRYNIPYEPMPIPEVGSGGLYRTQKYDLRVTGICLAVIVILVGGIVFQDKKRNELGSEIIHKK